MNFKESEKNLFTFNRSKNSRDLMDGLNEFTLNPSNNSKEFMDGLSGKRWDEADERH